MKVNFNIREKVIASLALLIIFVILSGLYLSRQIKERDRRITGLILNYQPSINYLSKLLDELNKTENIIKYHALAQTGENEIFITAFENLFSESIPEKTKALIDLSHAWTPEDRETMIYTGRLIMDSLYTSYKALIHDIFIIKSETIITENIFDEELSNRGMVFLISELEQNLNYLYDKKQSELSTLYNSAIEHSASTRKNIILIGIIIILFFFAILFSIFRHVQKNLSILQERLFDLNNGIIPSSFGFSENSEFSKVFKNLNKYFGYIRNLASLSTDILHKEFDSVVSPLSKEDELGNLLANLQENLKIASLEEEKRKIEDEQRTWVSAGIARINDIIRVSSGKVDELTSELIRELVNYTESGLGALYLLNSENEKADQIELVSAYAYDRKKYLQKNLEIGEGLVGSCIKENHSIYLTDIPKDYIKIKSGLGENEPLSLLISPINYNDIVYGAVEIASFMEFPPYRITFVETCCQNIATAISKLKPVA